MLRTGVLSGLMAAWAALCLGGAPSAHPATRPASGPATAPATQPASAQVAADTRAKIAEWVSDLASKRYRARQQARENLRKIVDRPGVDEVLVGHYRSAGDAEVKAALEDLLSGFGEPVAMVWRRGWTRKTGNSTRRMSQPAGAPCLLVAGSGQFVYDAASECFTGRQDDPPRVAFRQGRLSPEQLWKLKELIAASGVARLAPTAGIVSGKMEPGVDVAFYVRAGSRKRMSASFWATAKLGRGKLDSGDAELFLARAIRDIVAACPAEPYDGPLTLHAERELALARDAVARLPEWPLARLDLLVLSAQGGSKLDEKDVATVRKALAKTSMFQHRKYYGFHVFLVPWLKEARDLFYGGASGTSQLRLELKR